MTRLLLSTLLVLLGLCSATCASREILTGDALVVLEGATVFGPGGVLQPNAVVVLQGDRISRIGSVGEFRYPSTATIIDVKDRFILPGFIDMHVHVAAKARAEIMRTLLAHGITTARNPGADDVAGGVEARDLLERGELRGPRLVTAGPIINAPPDRSPEHVIVRSADEMRAEIRRQKNLGVDVIKLFWDVTPALFQVAVTEAHALGLKVAGHLGATTWTEAARLGVDFLEHSGFEGPKWDLVDAASLKAQIRGQHPSLLASGTVKPIEFYKRWSDAVDLRGPQMDALAATLKEHQVSVDPTLVTLQSLYYGDDLDILRRLEPERMPLAIPATWGDGWRQANPIVVPDASGQDFLSERVTWPIAMGITRALHERGVRITAGSDTGMPWITPGVSLHREMEILVDAGIPVRDVLLIATRNGAEALGLSAEIGTVEGGKVADFVVLRRNPVEDIRNTRSIEAVYHFGRRYDPDTLIAGRQ